MFKENRKHQQPYLNSNVNNLPEKQRRIVELVAVLDPVLLFSILQQRANPHFLQRRIIAHDLHVHTGLHHLANSHLDRVLDPGKTLAAEGAGIQFLRGQVVTASALITS
jgi:hypothetical protein